QTSLPSTTLIPSTLAAKAIVQVAPFQCQSAAAPAQRSVALDPRSRVIAPPGNAPTVCQVAPSHASTPAFAVATNTASLPAAQTSLSAPAAPPDTSAPAMPFQCSPAVGPTAHPSSCAIDHPPVSGLALTGHEVQVAPSKCIAADPVWPTTQRSFGPVPVIA